MQRTCTDNDAIGIGIKPIACLHLDALYKHGTTCLTLSRAQGGHGIQGQRTDTQIKNSQLGRITRATIDHDAGPAIARRRCGQIAPQQSAAHRSTAIDHQHAAKSWRFHSLFDMAVVLIAFDCQNQPGKLKASAIVLEHRGDDTDRTAVVGFVLITKVTGRKNKVRCVCHEAAFQK